MKEPSRAPRPVLDPLVLDRDADRYRRGRRTLGDLCLHYGVVGDGALHTAEVDVAARLDVLARLGERYAYLGDRDPEQLLWRADHDMYLRRAGHPERGRRVFLPDGVAPFEV